MGRAMKLPLLWSANTNLLCLLIASNAPAYYTNNIGLTLNKVWVIQFHPCLLILLIHYYYLTFIFYFII